jgi:hypothetical protein
MSDTWLENFRRRPGESGETPKPQIFAGLSPYQAFEAQDKVMRLDILRAADASHCPAYSYLLDIIYGRQFYSSFVLVYSFMTVAVIGRNLHDVVQAIRMGQASSICEFHPELFTPPEPDAPIITSIEVVVGERIAEALKETDEGEEKGREASR